MILNSEPPSVYKQNKMQCLKAAQLHTKAKTFLCKLRIFELYIPLYEHTETHPTHNVCMLLAKKGKQNSVNC